MSVTVAARFTTANRKELPGEEGGRLRVPCSGGGRSRHVPLCRAAGRGGRGGGRLELLGLGATKELVFFPPPPGCWCFVEWRNGKERKGGVIGVGSGRGERGFFFFSFPPVFSPTPLIAERERRAFLSRRGDCLESFETKARSFRDGSRGAPRCFSVCTV